MKEPFNKVTLKDGSVRYRLVVDIGRDERGRRKQVTRTFDTRREVQEKLARIRHETNLGTRRRILYGIGPVTTEARTGVMSCDNPPGPISTAIVKPVAVLQS